MAADSLPISNTLLHYLSIGWWLLTHQQETAYLSIGIVDDSLPIIHIAALFNCWWPLTQHTVAYLSIVIVNDALHSSHTHDPHTPHTHTPLTLHTHTNVPHTPPTHVPHTPPTHMSLILHSYMCPSHSTQTHLTPTVPFIYNNIYLFIRLTVQMDEFWLCNCKFCNIKYNNEKILYTISYQVCNMWKRH